MNKKLYVGNLSYDLSDEELKDHFNQAGNVTSANVIRYHDTGRSKGFGFVEMASEEEAKKAIDMFNGQELKGRKMVVSEARPPKPKGNFGGSFGRGNRFQRRDFNKNE